MVSDSGYIKHYYLHGQHCCCLKPFYLAILFFILLHCQNTVIFRLPEEATIEAKNPLQNNPQKWDSIIFSNRFWTGTNTYSVLAALSNMFFGKGHQYICISAPTVQHLPFLFNNYIQSYLMIK